MQGNRNLEVRVRALPTKPNETSSNPNTAIVLVDWFSFIDINSYAICISFAQVQLMDIIRVLLTSRKQSFVFVGPSFQLDYYPSLADLAFGCFGFYFMQPN